MVLTRKKIISYDRYLKIILLCKIFSESVWRIYYYVDLGGVAMDAEVNVDIDVADIMAELASITVTGDASGAVYSAFEFSGDASTIVSYSTLFNLIFKVEVRESDFASFEAILNSVWTHETGIELHRKYILSQPTKGFYKSVAYILLIRPNLCISKFKTSLFHYSFYISNKS